MFNLDINITKEKLFEYIQCFVNLNRDNNELTADEQILYYDLNNVLNDYKYIGMTKNDMRTLLNLKDGFICRNEDNEIKWCNYGNLLTGNYETIERSFLSLKKGESIFVGFFINAAKRSFICGDECVLYNRKFKE